MTREEIHERFTEEMRKVRQRIEEEHPMTHDTRELEEKYWNSKPKKKVTGEGIVVSLSKNEFIELLSNFHQELQKARQEERERIMKYLDRIDGENTLFGYQTAILNIKSFIKSLPQAELDQDKK